MAAFFSFFVENWGILAAILSGGLTLASLITALTPTPKDDAFVAQLMAWLSFLQPKTSVGTVKAPLTKPAGPTPLVTPRDASEEPTRIVRPRL